MNGPLTEWTWQELNAARELLRGANTARNAKAWDVAIATEVRRRLAEPPPIG